MQGGYSLAFLLLFLSMGYYSFAETEDRRFWYADAGRRLKTVLARMPAERAARNVIVVIGDGMGLSTITAGRIYRGQRLGLGGEEYRLAFEDFTDIGLAKTYNVDAQVGDSAACATALFCGAKTNYHRVGVDSSSSKNRCTGGRPLTSIIDWAQREGKGTGLVTNTRLTHSTPSAAYAHVPYRSWESSTDGYPGCKDIARQLVEDRPGVNINVLFGGGRRSFLPNTKADPETGKAGGRQDGRDLISLWKKTQRSAGRRAHYVWNNEQLDRLEPSETDSVLGLFQDSHMEFEINRDKGPGGDPSLADMTVKAIQILSKHQNGFLLIVEALDEAVKAMLATADLADTLVVVTADHSHVFTFGASHSSRNTAILGQDAAKDINNLTYTTLLYGNGPGHVTERRNLSNVNTRSPNYRQESAVPLRHETHGGEDVPVYAVGPGSRALAGTYEQSYVAHAISFAACIGPHRPLCKERQPTAKSAAGDISRHICALLVLMTLVVLSV